jgi:hypothetical protein
MILIAALVVELSDCLGGDRRMYFRSGKPVSMITGLPSNQSFPVYKLNYTCVLFKCFQTHLISFTIYDIVLNGTGILLPEQFYIPFCLLWEFYFLF